MEKHINRQNENTFGEDSNLYVNSNTNNSNFNYLYSEKLIKEEGETRAYKEYQIEIIVKRNKLYAATMSFDLQNRHVIFKMEDVEMKINFMDLLGFIPESRMSENVFLSIKNEFKRNSKIEENVFTKKLVSHLNYFPKFKSKQCNCCGWLCCKCSVEVIQRRAKNLELLIQDNLINEVEEIFNRIMLEDTLNMIQIKNMNKRKFLLFINPIGGKGVAIRIWNQVKNIFAVSDIEVEVFRTQHYQHAYEHTLVMDFRQYQGVLCCSGDGIVHEVVNAIFHREDKDEFIHSVPIGVIPGGTSNGFAKSLCEASGEICTPENCSYIISKGQVKEIDILEIETISREKKIYSFLSVAWGLIADIDLESENLRCCGPFRYTLYGAIRWMCLRPVYAALYYLPQNSSLSLEEIPDLKSTLEYTSDPNHDLSVNNMFIRENAQFNYFWAHNVAYTGETIHSAPQASLEDGFCDLLKMKNSAGKCNLLGQLFNQDGGEYYDKNGELKRDSGLEYVKTKCWRLIPKNNLNQNDDAKEQRNLPRFYSIDGERYPVEPIQVKTLRKSLKVFCLNLEH